jgi:methionyl-tRNA formyltransferase
MAQINAGKTENTGNLGSTISPGNFVSDGKTYLKFATTDGYILVTEVQLEGKKRMAIADLLRGIRL